MTSNNYYAYSDGVSAYNSGYLSQPSAAPDYSGHGQVASSYPTAAQGQPTYDQNFAAHGTMASNYSYHQPEALVYPSDTNQYSTGDVANSMYHYTNSSYNTNSYDPMAAGYDATAFYNQQAPVGQPHDNSAAGYYQHEVPLYNQQQQSVNQTASYAATSEQQPTPSARKAKPAKNKTRGNQNKTGEGGGKKKNSKTLTAYARFFQEIQHQVREQHPDAQFGDISKLIAARWEQLPQEEKDSYKKRAHEERNQCFLQAALEKANSVASTLGGDQGVYPPQPQHIAPDQNSQHLAVDQKPQL